MYSERFIDLNTLSQIPSIEIELAGCSNLLGDYCVARTNPLEHTLFYTSGGQGTLKTINNQYPLAGNSLAILPARQSFQVEIASEKWDVI